MESEIHDRVGRNPLNCLIEELHNLQPSQEDDANVVESLVLHGIPIT